MIMNKKRKDDILAEIYNIPSPGIQIPQALQGSQVGYELQRVIGEAIKWHTQEVARRIIENLYTQEDFEEDMGLK